MRVADGMVVTLEYTVHLADGTLLDSTGDCGPVTVMVGSGQLFPALEDRILGMQPGETRELSIPAADAYGEWRQELVRRDAARAACPRTSTSRSGSEYRLKSPDGKVLRFRLLEIDGRRWSRPTSIAPQAGQDLRATVTVVAVRAPTAEEERRGRV